MDIVRVQGIEYPVNIGAFRNDKITDAVQAFVFAACVCGIVQFCLKTQDIGFFQHVEGVGIRTHSSCRQFKFHVFLDIAEPVYKAIRRFFCQAVGVVIYVYKDFVWQLFALNGHIKLEIAELHHRQGVFVYFKPEWRRSFKFFATDKARRTFLDEAWRCKQQHDEQHQRRQRIAQVFFILS